MANPPARECLTQQVNFLRKTVSFNTGSIGTANTVLVGVLPNGAIVDPGSFVNVTTAFNAVSTNVLTVGTDASNLNLFGASDITEGTPGSYPLPAANSLKMTAATPVYVRYTQTGTAATTGAADIVIKFIPNIDG